MTHVLAEMVDRELCQHPSVMDIPEWEELAEVACTALHDLYQKIGGAYI